MGVFEKTPLFLDFLLTCEFLLTSIEERTYWNTTLCLRVSLRRPRRESVADAPTRHSQPRLERETKTPHPTWQMRYQRAAKKPPQNRSRQTKRRSKGRRTAAGFLSRRHIAINRPARTRTK